MAPESGYLLFAAVISDETILPWGGFVHARLPIDVTAFTDVDGDGLADITDSWGPASYSGFTMTINDHEYAIFRHSTDSTGEVFYIPYFDRTENLSYLENQSSHLFTTTKTVEDANVVNMCFLAGTEIATPDGERMVEDLAIGDLVLTADGRSVPVKWLGRQAMKPAVINMIAPLSRAPVCIHAGALGNHSDLYVTADHGMIIDGLVINASALINGTTIDWVPLADLPDSFTVYHIETEAHDVILANGAPAETFVDYVGRQAFDNFAEYVDLYGCDPIFPEMQPIRISAQRLVPDVIRARLGIVTELIDFDLPLSA